MHRNALRVRASLMYEISTLMDASSRCAAMMSQQLLGIVVAIIMLPEASPEHAAPGTARSDRSTCKYSGSRVSGSMQDVVRQMDVAAMPAA